MKRGVGKVRVTVSISQTILKELDEYCSQTKPVKTDRSPVVEIAIREYLKKEVKK